MNPEEFIQKWHAVLVPTPPEGPVERAYSQEHFIDLCRLLGHPTPAESDPERYRFEKPLTKITGSKGYADVWKGGFFGWEYKGPHKDLQEAYVQLKLYSDAMENPPLLVTSDMRRFVIHTNFTNTVAATYEFEFTDLAAAEKLEWLRSVFHEPAKLKPNVTREGVTREAADKFSHLALQLAPRCPDQQRVAHFLNRLIFCMFAEDAQLLPDRYFARLLEACRDEVAAFPTLCADLFRAMATGGRAGITKIEHFNGGLFDNDDVIALTQTEIATLIDASMLDWSNIEPAVLGTLFERGLDPSKRSQLGAHYTDPETIERLVRPVVVEPWVREWEETRSTIDAMMAKASSSTGAVATKAKNAAQKVYDDFLENLGKFRILDPACGSGNFLYLSLKGLKDFEKRVRTEAGLLGLKRGLLFETGPENLLGIEINPYAAELARVSIWIGELQWMIQNGYGYRNNPILRKLDQIACRDALLNSDSSESQWPAADVIVGNPPFIGTRRMRRQLGDSYVTALRERYEDRVPGSADLVCFWFAKSQDALTSGNAKRCGLVATQSIRAGTSRRVLERIVDVGVIFDAWSDQPWVNEGADVRVSLVAFGTDETLPRRLDGNTVSGITSSLSATDGTTFDRARLRRLKDNVGVSFQGTIPSGPFSVDSSVARSWLTAPNPSGRPNSDVLKKWINGRDIAQRPADAWLVDFGYEMPEAEACLYEKPFEHVLANVKPVRDVDPVASHRAKWWEFVRSRPKMRAAVAPLTRFIVTPRVAKHRLFFWLDKAFLPDSRLYVIACDDDVTFGILHSRIHEIWSLATSSRHGVGNDPTYNNKTCFETFPFPPGLEPWRDSAELVAHPLASKISEAAKALVELRDRWVNPPEWTTEIPEAVSGYPPKIEAIAGFEEELRRRTPTELYNAKPTWLRLHHERLDAAVAAAYGWTWPMTDQQVLEQLFVLSLSRPACGNSVDEGSIETAAGELEIE